jgi:hypothetical protein
MKLIKAIAQGEKLYLYCFDDADFEQPIWFKKTGY